MLDRDFVAVFRQGPLKSRVRAKKPYRVAMTWTRPALHCFDISFRQRTKPSPRPSESTFCAFDDFVDPDFPIEKRPGEGAQKGGIRHRKTAAERSNESNSA
jgi:hypothetical protein